MTSQRLAAAANEPQNWLTYSGNYSSTRYSPLDQITPANVKNLKLQWVYQAPVAGNWQTTPLVVDGIMYLTQRLNDVVALDATTGRAFWIYRYTPAQDRIVCCGANNRGLAILGDTLFMGTLDAQLIAIDAKTGRPIWKTEVAEHQVRIFDHARAARRQRQGDRRRRRRRVRHPRLHRRLRRGDRPRAVALLHDSRAGRAWFRDVGGAVPPPAQTLLRSRGLETWRRLDLADRLRTIRSSI